MCSTIFWWTPQKLEDKSIQLQSFYPIFFPDYPWTTIKKTKDEIWISIPGKLDFGRRDYYLVANALEQLDSKENLRILILGNTNLSNPKNLEFIEHIKRNNLQEHFVTFDAFLDDNIFHNYLIKSDYILIPLDTIEENYAKYKIMGCYNQAFGYRKTLISPFGLSHIPDIGNHSIFYEGTNGLSSVFQQICQGVIEKKEYPESKWSFELQKNNYVRFLEESQLG